MAHRTINGLINQYQIIIIIYKSIQNLSSKFWINYFFSVNLHYNHSLSFAECIKKIAPDVKTGDTAYFCKHQGFYCDALLSVWKNKIIIKQSQLIYIIDRFSSETPHGKSRWTEINVLSLIRFAALGQIPRIKYAIWL